MIINVERLVAVYDQTGIRIGDILNLFITVFNFQFFKLKFQIIAATIGSQDYSCMLVNFPVSRHLNSSTLWYENTVQ